MITKTRAIDIAKSIAQKERLLWVGDFIRINSKFINGDPCWSIKVPYDSPDGFDVPETIYYISMVTGECIDLIHLRGCCRA